MSTDREALNDYRVRTVRIGVWATIMVLAALFLYVLVPGQDEIRRGPALIAMGIGMAGALVVAALPWKRLFERGIGMACMYAWSVLDIVLITILISFSGESHMEVFFLYAFTTLFFAASYPQAAQILLLAFTVAAYLSVLALEGWPVEGPDVVARIALLLVLAYMASFLARELQRQMTRAAAEGSESARRSGLLEEVARAARSVATLDTDRVLQAVVGTTSRLGFDAANLVNYDVAAGVFHVREGIGLPAAYLEQPHPIDQGVAGMVLERRDTVTMEHYVEHPRAIPALAASGFQSMVGAPVWVSGRLEAALIGGTREARPMTPQDVEAFELLAAIAGRALENAQRFEDEHRNVRRLAELDRLKSDFISNVSHELRTPLTAIEGMGLTLERQWDRLDESVRRDLLRRLNANASTLHRIITTLLDFSRLEAGRMPVEWQPVEVAPFLHALVERLRSMLEDHTVTVRAPQDVVAQADPTLLERIVENLISNAVKHTPAGTHVTVSAVALHGTTVICVEDEGPGIPASELPHLGDRFFRGGDTISHATRGTGLGLALVRELLRLHGSDLEIESERGHGARFCFRLPTSAPTGLDAAGNREGMRRADVET